MAGLSSHRCPAWRASGLRSRKITGHDMHNRQAGSSAVSEARRNRRALANDDTSDDALLDSKYRVVPRPRAAGDSAICLVDCLLLIRQRDARLYESLRGPRLSLPTSLHWKHQPVPCRDFFETRAKERRRKNGPSGTAVRWGHRVLLRMATCGDTRTQPDQTSTRRFRNGGLYGTPVDVFHSL
jgi:hypothetical protein